MYCHRCDRTAAAGFTVNALFKAGEVNEYFPVFFCSSQCANVPFGGFSDTRYDVFACPDCSWHVVSIEPTTNVPNWYWSPEDDDHPTDYSCCKTCHVKRILRDGHVVTSTFGATGEHGPDRWVTDAQALDAGYTLVFKIAHGAIVLCAAMGVFIKHADARVVVVSLYTGSHNSHAWAIYAKPNGARARAAARLMCCAHRFDRGSALARLPLDMVRLLAQAVYGTCFAPEWIY